MIIVTATWQTQPSVRDIIVMLTAVETIARSTIRFSRKHTPFS